jgi:hypothetical protein
MDSPMYELEDLGILKATKIPSNLAWTGSEETEVLLKLLACGEGGMHLATYKKLSDPLQVAVLRLEIRDYIRWEYDRFGKKTVLCLSWKGDEAAKTLLKVARHQQKPALNGSGEGRVSE